MSLRVVATFTTLPTRYNSLLQSIKSIKMQDYQIDCIYLTIPKKSKRLNIEYPPIPEEISKLCKVVRTVTDYGPITKLYGALISEQDPNTIIISCDDDVIYDSTMVSKMIQYHLQNPNAVICATGSLIARGILFYTVIYPKKKNILFPHAPDISESGRDIDIIYGVTGVLYLRKFFPSNSNLYSELFKHAIENEFVFLNDDVLISGYLSYKNIKRKVCNIPDVIHQDKDKYSLSYNFIKQLYSINQSIQYLKSKGFFNVTESLSFEETILVRIVIIIFLILFLIFILQIIYGESIQNIFL